MKEVLEYSKEELEQLTTEELKLLKREADDKESYYNTSQLVQKLIINSLYGALGNRHFPLFNETIAAAITGNGRYYIQKMANYIETALQNLFPQDKEYIVYGDTDSAYFHIEPIMQKYISENPGKSITEYVKFADNFEKKFIQPVIQKSITDFANELNAYNTDAIGCEREIIADAAVFTAKKKYYARVRDSEGTIYPEDNPYIKVMGLEIAKSSTPTWAKKKLKESINHILDKDENDLRNWVQSIKQEYINAPLLDIAHVGGVSNLDYKLGVDKGIPIGSRAALCHNKYIEENNMTDKYEPIQAGDKCKRLFLQEPNPVHSNIIAFTNEQFIDEVSCCIDYDTNFEKTFISPLNLMVDSLDYNLNKETQELDDW